MKQHISALMDGELFDEEAEAVFDKLKRNPEGHDDWMMYHLIGDALRQPDHVHADISTSLRDRLYAEPTVLAPRGRAAHRARWFAVSAAASVMALSVVAWLSAKVAPPAATPQMAVIQQPSNLALVQQSGNVRPASLSARRSVNDYLMAHQEFSPDNNVQDAASYIHTVAGQ
ncbi:MAG TPA: sigma-E factor negative regulatory protein [Gallionellaceae bacterium]